MRLVQMAGHTSTARIREGTMVGIRWLRLPLVAVVLACTPPQRHGPREMHDSRVISEDEIVASGAVTAYEAVQKLRANFLTYRGETSLTRSRSSPYPTVYLDGQEFGPISVLRTIPAAQVSTIRLYRSWEGSAKYGPHYMSGIIEVNTRQ